MRYAGGMADRSDPLSVAHDFELERTVSVAVVKFRSAFRQAKANMSDAENLPIYLKIPSDVLATNPTENVGSGLQTSS